VSGADVLIDRAVANIPDAHGGFLLLFSAAPFPGHQLRLERRRADSDGNWYHSSEFNLEGWLCPALLRYFERAPREIYVQVKPRARCLTIVGIVLNGGRSPSAGVGRRWCPLRSISTCGRPVNFAARVRIG
jgi:hypothetical protein